MYMVVALIFTGIAFYYWKRTKIVEKQLEFEMADVRNMANVKDYHKSVQVIK